jgi:hypothetical protein
VLGEAGTGKYLPVVVCNDTIQDAAVSFVIRDADTLEEILHGRETIPANQNWQVGLVRTFASEQRLYLIEWDANGSQFGNHYLVGAPPVSFARYQKWLPLIAALPGAFDASLVAV